MFKKTYDAIICMTENQTHDIRYLFEQKQKNEKKKTIQIPNIEVMHRWVKNQFVDYCLSEGYEKIPYVINGIDEKFIWEEIIKSDLDKQKEYFSSIDINNICQMAMKANRLITEYSVNENDLKDNITYREVRSFYEWREIFIARCKKKNIITRYSFISLFIKHQKKYKIIKNQNLYLAGFDLNTPLLTKLKESLIEINNIDTHDNNSNKEKLTNKERKYDNPEAEIEGVIDWIKLKKKENKQKLLIISPALNQFQITLQNKIDREIQPDIFKDFNVNSIYSSDLRRPLSSEPIIRAAFNLLRLNQPQNFRFDIIYELLIFNNWIDSSEFREREKLGNYLKQKNTKKITVQKLLNLITKDPIVIHLKLDSLTKTLSFIIKNQSYWNKTKLIKEWIKLSKEYLNNVKWGKVNNLLSFENNNIDNLFKQFYQISNNTIIDSYLTFDQYLDKLNYYLENFVPSKHNNKAVIDINGYYENPIKKYDAVWLMNMNENFWPDNIRFNPLIPKSLQKKYHIFDDVYKEKLTLAHKHRLNNFSNDITISCSSQLQEVTLFESPGIFNKLTAPKPTKRHTKQPNHHEFISDDCALAITGNITIRSGIDCLSHYHKCPAWAFYEHRLGAKEPRDDSQEEITKMSRGNLIHKSLENFWLKHKNTKQLARMTQENLKMYIQESINPVVTSYQNTHPEINKILIKSEKEFLKSILYQWLSYEKNNRSFFSVIHCEQMHEININRINFKVRIDRIDQYDDNSKLLIDYKTGKVSPKSQWRSLKDLQIPIYAVFTNISGLNAISIGKININNIELFGLSSQLKTPSDGNIVQIKDWNKIIHQWKADIEQIASEYLSGKATVVFERENDLRYCNVLPLLRIAEKKWQYENPERLR